MLYCDYESRSRADLTRVGLYNYAQDASTEIVCLSWAVDDGPVTTWRPSEPVPAALRAAFAGPITAHNAAFERLITRFILCPDFGIKEPRLAQYICSAATARANGMPGSLEDLGRALNSSMKKDFRGSELIRKLSIPRPDGTFCEDPDLMAEFIRYCEMDVAAMRHMMLQLRQLSPDELADYHVSERINDRGILVDKPVAEAAIRYSAIETREIEAAVAHWTRGAVTTVRSASFREWVWNNVGPEAQKLMTVNEKRSIAKDVRANLLLLAEESPDEVPGHVAETIQCATDLWASSVAKYARMAAVCDEEDHRIRGAFILNGAAQSGRYSGHGIQLQNLVRKSAADPEAVRALMLSGAPLPPPATETLKSMLRPVLMAKPRHMLIIADWSSVEARGLPWLARAEERLDIFREGRDVYIEEAAGIYHKAPEAIDKAQRQIGKIACLSMGYGGSINAFAAMGRNYGVRLPEDEVAQIVRAWRMANTWCTLFWSELDHASRRAMRAAHTEQEIGRLVYYFDGDTLWVVLPCGRPLAYPQARFVEVKEWTEIEYLKSAWKPAATAKEWPRARLWPGLLAEQPTQGVCASLLRYALRECDRVGLPVIAHVHDEIVLEVPEQEVDAARAELTRIMTTPPAWADGFPLNVDVTVNRRYMK